MGTNLTGEAVRIWGLHCEGFCATRIAALVGVAEERVRGVIVGAWHDDKLAAKSAKRSRGA